MTPEAKGHKVKHTLATVMITMLFTLTAAKAELPCDRENVVLDGLISRGSWVCNPAWLDRSAHLEFDRLAVHCRRDIEEKDILQLFRRGAGRFDRSVVEHGHDGACAKVDQIMKIFEGPSPPPDQGEDLP